MRGQELPFESGSGMVIFVPFPMLFTFMRSLSYKRICAVPFPVLAVIFVMTRRYQVLMPGNFFQY